MNGNEIVLLSNLIYNNDHYEPSRIVKAIISKLGQDLAMQVARTAMSMSASQRWEVIVPFTGPGRNL